MNIPKELQYTKTHEWVRIIDAQTVRVGVTDYAQKEMGDIVYIDMPLVGDTFAVDEELAVLETQKAAAEVYAPVAGGVLAVNDAVSDKPELINDACYDAWLVEMSGAPQALLSAAQYEEFLKSEGH